jgi:hypothetical protein
MVKLRAVTGLKGRIGIVSTAALVPSVTDPVWSPVADTPFHCAVQVYMLGCSVVQPENNKSVKPFKAVGAVAP